MSEELIRELSSSERGSAFVEWGKPVQHVVVLDDDLNDVPHTIEPVYAPTVTFVEPAS